MPYRFVLAGGRAGHAGRFALLVALAAIPALLAPAVATAATETVSARGVTATFTYQRHGVQYHGETLTIKRHSKVVYSAAVHAEGCGGDCAPGALRGKSVHVLDLAHNGTEDVVLELFSGGAHCCTIEQVFRPGGGTYKKVERQFGDPAAKLVDLGHNRRWEFLTANDAFAYRFTDFATSGMPIQILTFGHGRFHDVTRAYPKLIATDATLWLNAFKSMKSSHYQNSEGVIAAWAADEDMLGHQKLVRRYLNQQAQAGHLNSLEIPGVKGHTFVVALQRFLKHHGYSA